MILRHTYAAWALAAGIPAHDLARYMGSSLRMIDLTYGHLVVRGSEEAARTRLDAFINEAAEAAERGEEEAARRLVPLRNTCDLLLIVPTGKVTGDTEGAF